jgi:hypothetical protein
MLICQAHLLRIQRVAKLSPGNGEKLTTPANVSNKEFCYLEPGKRGLVDLSAPSEIAMHLHPLQNSRVQSCWVPVL